MDNSVSVPVDAPGGGATDAFGFTPQEEGFLRAYADSMLRLEALVQAGFVPAPLDLVGHQAAMQRAGEIIRRAEHLPLSQICSSVGADKILFAAVLWKWCLSDSGNHALKALMLMGRIHGLWDKTDNRQPQVALVFTSAQGKPAEKPADLPFTMSSTDYSVFSDPRQPPPAEEKAG